MLRSPFHNMWWSRHSLCPASPAAQVICAAPQPCETGKPRIYRTCIVVPENVGNMVALDILCSSKWVFGVLSVAGVVPPNCLQFDDTCSKYRLTWVGTGGPWKVPWSWVARYTAVYRRPQVPTNFRELVYVGAQAQNQ
jgi:hypothetical protein